MTSALCFFLFLLYGTWRMVSSATPSYISPHPAITADHCLNYSFCPYFILSLSLSSLCVFISLSSHFLPLYPSLPLCFSLSTSHLSLKESRSYSFATYNKQYCSCLSFVSPMFFFFCPKTFQYFSL